MKIPRKTKNIKKVQGFSSKRNSKNEWKLSFGLFLV